MNPRYRKSIQSGFTLVEILIALALVTALTMMMFSAVAPWMAMRQKIETERRLEQVQNALETAYRVNAMRIEAQGGARLDLAYASQTHEVLPSVKSGPAGKQQCALNAEAAEALSPYMADDSNRNMTDGSKVPLCLFITPRQAQIREGVTIYYHVAAIVALGRDGVLGANTDLSDEGVLRIDPSSDDMGVVVNGFPIQYELYQETRRRIERVADIYGSYFTARYLGNPARDYSIDYFVSSASAPYYEQAGIVPPTGSTWADVATTLRNLGLGPDEQVSAYESENALQVANQKLSTSELVGAVQVQEPDTKAGLALPPYTALLRARLPGPEGTYLLRVVPGNY